MNQTLIICQVNLFSDSCIYKQVNGRHLQLLHKADNFEDISTAIINALTTYDCQDLRVAGNEYFVAPLIEDIETKYYSKFSNKTLRIEVRD